MNNQKKFYDQFEFWFVLIFLAVFFITLKVDPISLGVKWNEVELTTTSLPVISLLAAIFFAYRLSEAVKETPEEKLERAFTKALDDYNKLHQQFIDRYLGKPNDGDPK